MWHDDTACAFYRRLCWSPEGTMALAPAGIFQASAEGKPRNATYVLPRNDLSRPAAVLPGVGTPSVAARFCPIAFRLPEVTISRC